MNLNDLLDTEVRIAVRHRDIGTNTGARCFTCNHWFPAELLQVGHFVRRRHNSVRWLLKNNHCQCNTCNVVKDGNEKEYEKALDAKYGEGFAEQLRIEGHKRSTLTRYDKIQILKDLREKNKQNKRLIDML